jgi:hypothetical protein
VFSFEARIRHHLQETVISVPSGRGIFTAHQSHFPEKPYLISTAAKVETG